MIFFLLLSIFLPIAICFLILHLYILRNTSPTYYLLKISLAIGLGFGSSSSLFFLWLLVIGPPGSGLIFVETGVLLGLIVLALFPKTTRDYQKLPDSQSHKTEGWHLQRVVFPVFLVTLIMSVLGAVYRSLNSPHGPWDSWAIWNTHARFLFRGGERWTDAFHPLLNHPGYPLLTPAFIARGWSYIGADTVAVPIMVALLFTFAVIGLTVAAVVILRDRTQGWLAGLALLGTIPFLFLGIAQHADVPLGFYFLATIVLLSLQEESGVSRPGVLILAGLAAGLAAWTKNEGLLFLVAIFPAHFLVTVLRSGWKRYFTDIRYLVIGLLPILLIIGYFKLKFAPTNYLFAGQGLAQTLEKLINPSRYLQVGKDFILSFLLFKEQKYDIPITIVLIVYPFFLGIDLSPKNRSIITTALLACGLMIAGYFFVYILTPADLSWQLLTSLSRLFLHLWPLAIFVYFLTVRSPEPAFIKPNV